MFDNIDIKPPEMPKGKKVFMVCEMISQDMADWFNTLSTQTREIIVFDAYIKFNLEQIRKEKEANKNDRQ